MGFHRIVFFVFIWISIQGLETKNILYAQINLLKIVQEEAKEGKSLKIIVKPPADIKFSSIKVFYRHPFTKSFFSIIDANQTSGGLNDVQYIVTIPDIDVAPPAIEYYVLAEYGNGQVLSYPEIQPREFPAVINVEPQNKKEEKVEIVSPEKNQNVRQDELVVIFSYPEINGSIDVNKSSLYFNGVDVTRSAIITESVVSFVPPVFIGNASAMFIARDATGKELSRASNYFRITAVEGTYDFTEIKYFMNLQAEGRIERKNSTDNYIGRGNVSFALDWAKMMKIGGSGFMTSEDEYTLKPTKQPLNRFNLYVDVPYFRFEGGDMYLNYNYYLHGGEKVRGVQGIFQIKAFRVAVIYGETQTATSPQFTVNQSIINTNDPLRTASINTLRQNGYIITDTSSGKYTLKQTANGQSTFDFRREYIGAVIGVNDPSLQLEAQFSRKTDQIDRSQYNYKSVLPQQSTGVGVSLNAKILKNILDVYGDIAYTIVNKDITAPSFQSTTELGNYLQNYKDQVFQSLNRFNIDYSLLKEIMVINPSILTSNFIGLSSVAARAGFKFTLFSNFLQFEYARQGGDFNAFTPFYLRNIQYFRVSDRVRLFDNRLIINAGFEYMTDNLDGEKNFISQMPINNFYDRTTVRMNIKGGVWFNIGSYFPTVQFDFTYQTNVNPFPDAYDDKINQVVTKISGLQKQANNTLLVFSGMLQKEIAIYEHSLGLDLSAFYQSNTDNRSAIPLLRTVILNPTETNRVISGVTYYAGDITLLPADINILTVTTNARFKMYGGLYLGGSFSFQQTETYISKTTKQQQFFNLIDLNISYPFLNQSLVPALKIGYTFGNMNRIDFVGNLSYTPFEQLVFNFSSGIYLRQAFTFNDVTLPAGLDFLFMLRINYRIGNY